MLKPILNNTCVGQAVYDPFCGSGTTLIAAEQSGRICYMMEINPVYCDIIIKRFCEFTKSKENIYKITNGRKIKIDGF
jgi:DNA modification methylase